VAGTASAFALELRGVGKVFGEVVALTGINLEVPRLPRVGFAGPSGGGKTTLLRIVADVLEPDTGLVRAEDATTARQRLARCALMPQRDLLLPWRTAPDNAATGLENRGASRAAARRRTRAFFERLGLAGSGNARPAQLPGGGVRQRVGFLRTLMAGKDILLLDEPFAALNSITRSAAPDSKERMSRP
jgi:ABC-type nitrate/sulfonate/bicarbonate transport system ATPase subunit